jgi:hypothetical protein
MRACSRQGEHLCLRSRRPQVFGYRLIAVVAATCLLSCANAAGATAAVPVNNLAPEVVGGPAPGERIVCGAGSWSGAVNGFTYAWVRDGVTIASGVAYVIATADKGHALWCVVTAHGPEGEAQAVSSNSVHVPGVPTTKPRDETPPQVSGQSTVGSTLTCSPGTWSGSPAPTFSYQWVRDEAIIAGATRATHTVENEDIGHSLSCEVTASNSAGSESAMSNSVAVPALKPVNEVAPRVLGLNPSRVGESVSCAPGRWSETPTPRFSYQWVRDRGLFDEAPIAGAVGSGYTIALADQLHSLSCVVTATNSAGSTEASSSNSLSVAGSPPQNVTPPSVEGSPAIGHTLTCNVGAWSGAPAPSFQFTWVRDRGLPNEQLIGWALTSQYTVGAEDGGQSLTCEVKAKNSEGTAAQVSDPVVIPAGAGHEAPLELAAPSVSGAGVVGATLSCSSGSWAGEPAPTLSYGWLRDGVVIGGQTAPEFVVTQADRGHALSCRVTAINEEGVAFAVSNNAVTIAGLAPEDLTRPMVTGKRSTGEQLTCLHGEWSGAPAPSYAFQWLREGAAIPSATAQTYIVASEDGGALISCRVTASNGAGTAEATSEPFEVPGRQPRNTSAPTASGTPRVGSTLTCSSGTWTGQPAPTFVYRWLLGGAPIPGATASVYTITSDDAGLSLTCEVTASNHEGARSVISAPVHVPGAAPLEVEPPRVSGSPSVGEALSCLRGVWTGTPPPAFSYQWLRDGTAIPNAAGSVYTVELGDEGHVLACEVTATNSEGTAGPFASDGLAIPNPTISSETNPLAVVAGFGPTPGPPTSAQILASLGAQIAHSDRRARASFLRRTSTYSFPFRALGPGRLLLYWYGLAKDPQHPTAAAKTVLLAQSATSYAGAGTRTVKIRLNTAGKRAFSESKLVKLTVKAVFAQPHLHAQAWREIVVVSH